MPAKPGTSSPSKPLDVNTGEPTQDEISASRYLWRSVSVLPAQKSGTRAVSVGGDASSVAQSPHSDIEIVDLDGNPLDPKTIFPFTTRPSNNLTDTYFTYQPIDTLVQYAQDAIDGRAFMLGHDYMEQPAGYSYDGWVETDGAVDVVEGGEGDNPTVIVEPPVASDGPLLVVPARLRSQRGMQMEPPGGEPLAWLYMKNYIVRDMEIAQKSSNQIIAAIEARVMREMSIGFLPKVLRCNICHLDIYDWTAGCPHMPGVWYEIEGGVEILCVARVEGGQLIETSAVYKGSCPDAVILQTKARMVAAHGRLTTGEANQISALEAKIGQRILDPSQLQRVWSKVVTVPALLAPVVAPATQRTSPASTLQTQTNTKKEKPALPTANNRAQNPSTRDIDPTDPAQLAQVVADQATSDAQALADQIAAKQGIIDGLNAQVQALQNDTSVDADGNPVDHTADIQALNDQITAAQGELDALKAELDGVNQTATDTGGTPTDASAGTTPPASGTPAQAQANSVHRVRAALQQVDGIMRNHVLPRASFVRAATDEQLMPIIASVQKSVDDLNALLDAANQPPARSAGDRVIFSALARANGGKPSGFAHVRQLILEAEAGRDFRTQLIEECVKSQVRALGAAYVDAEQYRKQLRNLSTGELKAEAARFEAIARQILSFGRTLPTDLALQDAPKGNGGVRIVTETTDDEPGGVYGADRKRKTRVGAK